MVIELLPRSRLTGSILCSGGNRSICWFEDKKFPVTRAGIGKNQSWTDCVAVAIQRRIDWRRPEGINLDKEGKSEHGSACSGSVGECVSRS